MEGWTAVDEEEHLGPHCGRVASLGLAGCPECEGAFKSPRRAGVLSVVFPGLGDFYMGHRKLAVMEILFAGLLWLVFLMPTPEYPLTVGSGVFLVGILVVFVHVPDAVGTWHLARGGVYPHRPGRAVSFSEVVAEGGGPSRW